MEHEAGSEGTWLVFKALGGLPSHSRTVDAVRQTLCQTQRTVGRTAALALTPVKVRNACFPGLPPGGILEPQWDHTHDLHFPPASTKVPAEDSSLSTARHSDRLRLPSRNQPQPVTGPPWSCQERRALLCRGGAEVTSHFWSCWCPPPQPTDRKGEFRRLRHWTQPGLKPDYSGFLRSISHKSSLSPSAPEFSFYSRRSPAKAPSCPQFSKHLPRPPTCLALCCTGRRGRL